ncbi:mobile mystery protein A [Proteus cibi]|uniref:mobile mystery protein A n=1 Tax=Proteus cibi TaxID=2050966 RepID=UPI000D69BCC7|nr:mobile mystery protein A [Proteus cibi]MBS6210026.1 mobile mystery protein A [Proteus hauseri]
MNFFKTKNDKNIVKHIVIKQYQAIANSFLGYKLPRTPKEGWVRTIRKALDMSGAQLAEKLDSSRNRISILERREIEGDITLNQLKLLAEQLNCDFTYALVPKKPVEEIIEDRVTEIAIQSLDSNAQNMFLEAQSIDKKAQEHLLEQAKKEIIASGGRIIWKNIKEDICLK